jgi:hypothetical protein
VPASVTGRGDDVRDHPDFFHTVAAVRTQLHGGHGDDGGDGGRAS